MQARIKSPVFTLPGAMDALQALSRSTQTDGVARATHELVHLRASQINGCSVCVDMHSRALVKLGETSERIACVAAWRDAPYYSEAERAALALTEALTRLSDREDPVPDGVWQQAARHYGEAALASLVLSIAQINLWNRLNVAVRQVSGEWTGQYAG